MCESMEARRVIRSPCVIFNAEGEKDALTVDVPRRHVNFLSNGRLTDSSSLSVWTNGVSQDDNGSL